MVDAKQKKNLGRGLSALLGDAPKLSVVGGQNDVGKRIGVDKLKPGRYQPRTKVNEADIDELAISLKAKGVLQPLLVRVDPDNEGFYEIIAGERRWQAAQKAGLHEVPVIVRAFSDQEALEVGLIENLQRQDLSVMDEAAGYRRLMDEFNHTQDVLAQSLGKSRSHVANTLRLLSLPKKVQTMIENGLLSAGHGRALLNHPDCENLADEVVKKQWSVRQIEARVKKPAKPATSKKIQSNQKSTDTIALERDLALILGLNVSIDFDGQKGRVAIDYENLDQLDDILLRLRGGDQQPVLVDKKASNKSEYETKKLSVKLKPVKKETPDKIAPEKRSVEQKNASSIPVPKGMVPVNK